MYSLMHHLQQCVSFIGELGINHFVQVRVMLQPCSCPYV